MRRLSFYFLPFLTVSLAAHQAPRPRADGGSAAYDHLRSVIVAFGGGIVETGELSAATWEWDGNRWTELHPASSPAPRFGHGMQFDTGRRRVVLFGGVTLPRQYLGDTWEWNGTNWTEVRSRQSPSPRMGHTMFYDPGRRRVILFGGYDAYGQMDDVWEWDGTNWQRRSAGTARDTTALRASPTLRSDLRTLAIAQEAHFADSLGYSASLDQLKREGYQTSTGVTVVLLTANARGWSAYAFDAGRPRLRCGIFIGEVTPPFPEVRNEGEPVCIERDW
ncbi:MAG: Kelch repeat-containing protein [Gemmatimonadales bacterium]